MTFAENMVKNSYTILALIPARGGSKGIPRKNIKELAGKPLIAHNIEAAKNSKYIQGVYVSTDDLEISRISQEFGAIAIDRPAEMATDQAPSELALFHFADNVHFDVLVFLQCTSPLTRSEDIDGAVEKFLSGHDSVLSVCEDHGGFLCGGFTWNENGEPFGYDYKNRPRRQDVGKKYRENGAIYVMSREGLLKHRNRLHGKIGLYIMPRHRSFEIDEPGDFEIVEVFIKNSQRLL